MARPKGKLFALLAVFAAIGLVAASGAFTSVDAERTAEVNVEGDASALLGISENTSGGVDSGVVSTTSDDETELNFNDGNGDATGINVNATTDFDSVLDVTNNGNSEVELGLTLEDNAGDDSDTSAEDPSNIITVNTVNNSQTDNLEGDNVVTLSPGDTTTLSFSFDTTVVPDLSGDDILDTITLEATSTSS